MDDNDLAKAVLADCDAFESAMRAAEAEGMRAARDAFAKFQQGNEETKKALAMPPAQGF